MKKLLEMVSTYQEINVEQKGVNFTEEDFTNLYEEAFAANIEHMSELRYSTVRGILVGATSIGLTWLGVEGVKKLRKRKPEVIKEEKRKVILEEVKTPKSDLSDVDEIIKEAKKMSKKNRDALAAVIAEIKDNEKGGKK